MDAAEQIRKFEEFFGEVYKSRILNRASKGDKFVIVDFKDLLAYDTELSEELLAFPEETIKAAEIAAKDVDIPSETKGFRIRFKNLPETQKMMISDVRSSSLGKLLTISGIVRQKSDVRPQVTTSRFECPNCGNVISVLQLESTFREPDKCGCGRKGKFKLLSKELVDAQAMVLEESPDELEGGEQPKRLNVFLKEDLVSPITDKRTNPGNRVVVVGMLKEIPVVVKGTRSTRFDLMFEANYIEALEEDFYEIQISKEEEKAILELSQDPKIYQRLADSIVPSIYGYERIKEALLLQLLGGIHKKRKDGSVSRGDMHVLLVGDPGCIAGDSMVALYFKGIRPIKQLGESHLQEIREFVSKTRRNSSGSEKPYDVATKFHIYRNQPVLRVKTETGKSVVATYNQPFLTRRGWARADELSIGEGIRVMPSIPNVIKKFYTTGFAEVEKKSGRLKDNVKIPEQYTPELAALCGYVIGDGNVHPNGYRVTCYVNHEEADLIGKLSELWQQTFNIAPRITMRQAEKGYIAESGGMALRQVIRTQPITLLEIESRQVAANLSFLKGKAVPQAIFESPKKVVAAFVKWLFEADGTAFCNGRGRTSVQLKSKSQRLLEGVQLLLLYFGIQSRIIEDNLCIRRAHDIKLFKEKIGFASAKKIGKLEKVIESLKDRTMHLRKGLQRYEKVVEISPAGITDVYDFEVPKSKRFVANGIVCHNSGKSQMLKRISMIAPKGRYVSGKGSTGAGLTAAVVKDEFLGGWSLEAGALVLSNNGVVAIDEMDKMSEEDRGAMHEALEQQSVSIAKANIQATLSAKTTVLAAANPKFGRFDPHGLIAEQIDIPPTLINRFDLIFPIKDLPNPESDEKLATHILEMHRTPDTEEKGIPTQLLKKYIAYARQKAHPKLTEEALNEIKKFYVEMRNRESTNERAARAIPVSARQLEALVRMAEAHAKAKLKDKVEKGDARKAIELLMYCLLQVGLDRETGAIDIDRIGGMGASQRNKIYVVKEVMEELERRVGKVLPIDDIQKAAKEKGVEVAEVEEIIEKLKRTGDIFEPKFGFFSRI